MANTDVFGRNTGDEIFTFTADQMRMTFVTDENGTENSINAAAGGSALGFFVTQVDITYTQTISPVLEIGANRRAFIAGRPSGTCNIQHLLGPVSLSRAALNKLGDVCNLKNNHLFFYWNAECNDSTNITSSTWSDKLELKYVIAKSIRLNIRNQDFQLTDTLDLDFAYLVNNDATA